MEDQLEKELRFHLDQHENDLIGRGESPAEARRRVRVALGGPEQVKEHCRDARGTRWAEELVQDTRYALRILRQRPGFVSITILILALGIGATTAMFAVINAVLLRPLAFPQADRLVVVHGNAEHFGEFWGFSYPDFVDLSQTSGSLVLAAWTDGGGTVSSPGEPGYVDGRQISGGLFSTLGVVPEYGRAFREDEDRPGGVPVAMISYDLWQRRFQGDPSAVGKKLAYDGKDFVVVGILPAGFQLTGEADVFTPLGQSTDPHIRNREARFIQVIGRLRPGVSLSQAEAELASIGSRLAKEYPKSNGDLSFRVHPLLHDLVKDVRGTLWLLLSAVGLVLLITCVNIAGLFLTRAISRERELAMRVALGAGRSRLVRQCVTESAVLGICGGVLGIVLAVVSVHRFAVFWPGHLPRAGEIRLDWRVLFFAAGISLVCGVAVGLTPALRISIKGLEQTLRSGGRSVRGSSRHLHNTFVVSELALALVLLVAAGMLGQTLLTLSSVNPGFNVQNVLTARFALSPAALTNPARMRSAWEDVLDRARRVPGVEFAALADIVPMGEGQNVGPFRTTPARPPANEERVALASTVTPGYLDVMGIPLLEGRFFDENDRDGSRPVVVVDENLAEDAFGRKDVVGRHLWIGPTTAPASVVGVVGHVRHWGLAGDTESRVRDQLYYPFAQVPAPMLRFFSSVMSITVRTRTSPLNIVESLRRQLRGASGDQALYKVRTMEQLVSASLGRQRFLSVLFGIFAGLALLLASIGLYGLLAYVTGQRIPEIGVRIAVGASVRDIIRLVLAHSLKMVMTGAALGMVGAIAAMRVLQHVVEGMQPVDGRTVAAMVLLLVVAALIASFVPTRRASRVDPVDALRQE
ncbi:MAG: ABC transporter permease [Acidobacteriaceae bacterium]|nr:ABC transporter permease [Acidobacteriaceae bacterium]